MILITFGNISVSYQRLHSPPGSCQAAGSCGSAAAGSRPWPAAERPLVPVDWSVLHDYTWTPSRRCHRRPATHTPHPAATQEAWRHISSRSPKTWWTQSKCLCGVEVKQDQCFCPRKNEANLGIFQKHAVTNFKLPLFVHVRRELILGLSMFFCLYFFLVSCYFCLLQYVILFIFCISLFVSVWVLCVRGSGGETVSVCD